MMSRVSADERKRARNAVSVSAPTGRYKMPPSTSSSISSRRGISPRRRGYCGREAGSPWSIRKRTHLIELRRRYRLLGQHREKARRYREATSRMIGPAAVTRIVRHMTLAPDAVRDIVLMGPNARHPARTPLLAEAEPIEVTFDIAILLARKRARSPTQNPSRRGKG
jgi:hypothetical protein